MLIYNKIIVLPSVFTIASNLCELLGGRRARLGKGHFNSWDADEAFSEALNLQEGEVFHLS
jgi:hypothetical protein